MPKFNESYSGSTLYLDTFMFSNLVKDQEFASAVQKTIKLYELTLVINVVNLIELWPHKRRLVAILNFIASVPFAIACDVTELVNEEVKSYPNAATLPFGFKSLGSGFSQQALVNALLVNVEQKVAIFAKDYNVEVEKTLAIWAAQRESSGLVDTSESGVEAFLLNKVMGMLCPDHLKFLQEEIGADREVNLKHFQAYYIQALAIYFEFYEQNKLPGQSDVGDLLHLGFAPYIGLNVLDKERADLLSRISRRGFLNAPINCMTMRDFRNFCTVSTL